MTDINSQYELPPNMDRFLKILSNYYEKHDQSLLREIIVNSEPQIRMGWTQDNWNGGSYGHALYLSMPESLYLEVVEKKAELQSKIATDLNNIHSVHNEYIEEVFFNVEVPDDQDWRKDSGVLLARNRTIPDPVAKRLWEEKCFRVFLSHKTEVKKETSKLKSVLRLFGISCFVAHEDICPSKEWQIEIENALHTMDTFVALLTKGFHDSLWTDQEVGFALARGVPILAVRLGTDPYGFIGKFQALSCSWEKAPIEIMKILIKKTPMLNAFIHAVQDCDSYENGNTISELLPFIDKLTDKQVQKLIGAFNENNQVRKSFGFDGSRSASYGEGLCYHLRKITKKDFRLSNRGYITSPTPS